MINAFLEKTVPLSSRFATSLAVREAGAPISGEPAFDVVVHHNHAQIVSVDRNVKEEVATFDRLRDALDFSYWFFLKAAGKMPRKSKVAEQDLGPGDPDFPDPATDQWGFFVETTIAALRVEGQDPTRLKTGDYRASPLDEDVYHIDVVQKEGKSAFRLTHYRFGVDRRIAVFSSENDAFYMAYWKIRNTRSFV